MSIIKHTSAMLSERLETVSKLKNGILNILKKTPGSELPVCGNDIHGDCMLVSARASPEEAKSMYRPPPPVGPIFWCRGQSKCTDALLHQLFRSDFVKQLGRGLSGIPYVMQHPSIENGAIVNQSPYVLKLLFYKEKYNYSKCRRMAIFSSASLSQTKRPAVFKRQRVTILPGSNVEEEEDVARPENVDIQINNLLAEFAKETSLPFVNLPILSFSCTAPKALDIMMRHDAELELLRNELQLTRQGYLQYYTRTPRALPISVPGVANVKECKTRLEDLKSTYENRKRQYMIDFEEYLGSKYKRRKTGSSSSSTTTTQLYDQKGHLTYKYSNTPSVPRALVFLCEYASAGSLADYLQMNFTAKITLDSKFWRSILAQLFCTLHCLLNKWPAFRHNDLHPGNFLLHARQTSSQPYQFLLHAPVYAHDIPSTAVETLALQIEDCGFEGRLADFDFSTIDGCISNRKIHEESAAKHGISSAAHAYYDVHTFCNTMLCNEVPVPDDVLQLFHDIVPLTYRYPASRFGRLKLNDSKVYTTCWHILVHHPFFAPYRIGIPTGD